jgi:DNA-binding NarL/FixJ family response regulator
MIKIVLAGMEGPGLAPLRRFFESTDGVQVEGHVPLAADAAAYAQRTGAAVLAIYLAASTGDTFDVVRQIRGAAPSLRLLIVSAHAERAFAARAFEAGANGYLWASAAENEAAAAVAELAAGGLYASLDVERRPRRGLRASDGARSGSARSRDGTRNHRGQS